MAFLFFVSSLRHCGVVSSLALGQCPVFIYSQNYITQHATLAYSLAGCLLAMLLLWARVTFPKGFQLQSGS